MTTSRVQLEVFSGSQGLMFAIPAKILDLSLVYHVLCIGGFSVKLDVSHSSLYMYINVLSQKLPKYSWSFNCLMAKIIHPPYTGHCMSRLSVLNLYTLSIVSLSVTMTVTIYKHKNRFFV